MTKIYLFSKPCVPTGAEISIPPCVLQDIFNTYTSILLIAIVYAIINYLVYKIKTYVQIKTIFAWINIILVAVILPFLDLQNKYFSIVYLPFLFILISIAISPHIVYLLNKPKT